MSFVRFFYAISQISFKGNINEILLKLHIEMKIIRYYLPIDLACVLVCVEEFGIMKNAWLFLWEKVTNLSIFQMMAPHRLG